MENQVALIKQALSNLYLGLNKGNLKGAFELEEAEKLHRSYEIISTLVNDLYVKKEEKRTEKKVKIQEPEKTNIERITEITES